MAPSDAIIGQQGRDGPGMDGEPTDWNHQTRKMEEAGGPEGQLPCQSSLKWPKGAQQILPP